MWNRKRFVRNCVEKFMFSKSGIMFKLSKAFNEHIKGVVRLIVPKKERVDECPICGFPYAFHGLSLKEAYKRCVEIHQIKVELLD